MFLREIIKCSKEGFDFDSVCIHNGIREATNHAAVICSVYHVLEGGTDKLSE